MVIKVQTPKLRIAIVGSGIAGLSLVNALQRYCDMSLLEVTLFEAARHLSPKGAGIVLYQRPQRILREIGLGAGLEKYVSDHSDITWRLRYSDREDGFDIDDMRLEDGVYLFHRHDFHKVLLDSLSPDVRICLDHRLMDYTTTSTETTLTFSNGTTATCDLLIGADGLRSHVRRDMLGALATKTADERYLESIQPVFTGTYVYRGLVDAEDLAKRHPGHQALKTPIQWLGKYRHLTTYPIGQGRYVNFALHVSDYSEEGTRIDGNGASTPATIDDVRAELRGWDKESMVLIDSLSGVTKWPVMELYPLPAYADERVILVGDAAHAMTHHVGAGASQGIEDGFILARCICKALKMCTGDARDGRVITQTVELYNRLRVPMSNYLLARARVQGKVWGLAFEDEKVDLGVFDQLPENYGDLSFTDKAARLSMDSYSWFKSGFIREMDALIEKELGKCDYALRT
ncbi:hypothetical protein EV714DRAFT_277451 [Schizophyllum commune]